MAALDEDAPFTLAGPLSSGEAGPGGPATEQDWLRAAAAVLRRSGRLSAQAPDADVLGALTRKTLEGIAVPPLGTAAAAAGLSAASVPAVTGAGWDIRALVTDADPGAAGASAVADLENGATSLWLQVGEHALAVSDLAAALDGVYLDMAPVVLQPVGADGAIGAAGDAGAAGRDLAVARSFADAVRTRGIAPAPGTNLGADPLARVGRGSDLTAELSEITALANDLGVRAIVVDGTVAHAAGAGDVAELGYTLAAGAEYLRLLTRTGLSVREAVRLIEFRYAATGEQFVTVAKFRAARTLWHRVAELSGADPADRGQSQHAVTSGPMMTRYDPWVNLMRTTVAAFSAGVGGADAVTVLPFDAALGVPEALGRRLARNISSLLISEAHVAEVADPAAGAYAVEMLTAQIADAAWAEFARIERDGGISQVVDDGSLHARWASTARERRIRIAHRKIPITGVSEFPHRDEVLPERTPPPPVGHGERWATEFEDLRDHPAAGPVFLATLGPLAAHTARASFAANLFTAGGVDTVTAGPTGSAADVVDAYRPTRAPVACLAGTDAAYGDLGPEVIAALRAAGARWVVLAGRPAGPAADLAELIDDHVAMGEDLLGFLRRTRAHLEPAGVTR